MRVIISMEGGIICSVSSSSQLEYVVIDYDKGSDERVTISQPAPADHVSETLSLDEFPESTIEVPGLQHPWYNPKASDRALQVMPTLQIDFLQLKAQKLAILYGNDPETGILNLIDSIQDQAAEAGILPKHEIFCHFPELMDDGKHDIVGLGKMGMYFSIGDDKQSLKLFSHAGELIDEGETVSFLFFSGDNSLVWDRKDVVFGTKVN